MEQKYDLLIVGAGPGGYIAAQKAARLGKSVLVVDKKEIGGTCVNRGCISTKALIHASMLYHEMKHCEEFGISADHVKFGLQKIYEYKDHSAEIMREDLQGTFEKLNIRFVQGEATIHPNKKVHIKKADGTEEVCYGRNILIATGAKPIYPNIPGVELDGVMTSEELLSSNESQYESLLILGGGVIGLEVATVFNALGTEVTVVEAADRLLPKMDKDFSDALEEILTQRGIKIYKSTIYISINRRSEKELHSAVLINSIVCSSIEPKSFS